MMQTEKYDKVKLKDKFEFDEQNTQDIMCLPRNHGISRFVSWRFRYGSGMIYTKGGVPNEPTKNR